MNAETLKPLLCPFCGGEPETYYGDDDRGHADNGVHCPKCDFGFEGDDCIERWNARSPEPERRALIDEAYKEGFSDGWVSRQYGEADYEIFLNNGLSDFRKKTEVSGP